MIAGSICNRPVNFMGWDVTVPRAITPGRVYYVSPAGDNSNKGTYQEPFLSLAHAYHNVVEPGDTIVMMDGTHTEPEDTTYFLLAEPVGTQTKRVTIRAQNYGQAILDGQDTVDYGILFRNDTNSYGICANLNILGLVVKGFEKFGIYAKAGNYLIQDCTIRNNGYAFDPSSSNGCGGIYTAKAGQNGVIDRNIIYQNGRLDLGSLDANNNHDHGIYHTSRNCIISNNLIYDNESFGIHLVGYVDCSNNRIINNTICLNRYRGGIVLYLSECKNNLVQNNLIYGNSNRENASYGISFSNDGGSQTIVNNLVAGNATKQIDSPDGSGTTISGNIYTLPWLNSDYKPRPSSPAIDAGKLTGGSNYDLEGRYRKGDNKIYIGAYEVTSGSDPSTSTLKIRFRFTKDSPSPCDFKIDYVDTSKHWWLDGTQYNSGDTASMTPDDWHMDHTLEIEDSQLNNLLFRNLFLQIDASSLSGWDITGALSLYKNFSLAGDISNFSDFSITTNLEIYFTGLYGNTSAFQNYTCNGYVTMENLGLTGDLSDFSNMNPTVVRMYGNNITGDLADIRHWNTLNYKRLHSCQISSFSENDTLFPNSLEIRLNDNVLDSISIDNIIIAKDNDGLSNGILALENNSPPTSASSTALSNLISKGWTVTHD